MTDTTRTDSAQTPGQTPAPKPKLNPWVRAVIEYGPIIGFFVGYMLVRDQSFMMGGREYDGIVAVTAGFIPLQTFSTWLLWKLTGKISGIQIATVVLVIIMGGITIWLNDERFIKMKPTILYVFFAAVLGFGLLRGQSYLRAVMDHTVPMEHEGWMKLTLRMTVFFAALALANEAVWRMMSTDAWVNFKTFGLPIAIFVFFVAQSGLFNRYAVEDSTDDS